ncbi:hypothetical protein [Neorhizobium alkalisoli]|uniref:hypothetical protein n=1 Tax=Neorhizobium alkalisoli TaxID=528178 RepID=UPI001646CF44|nr:hypothetical protein [Neorhizobium alkalisoli]
MIIVTFLLNRPHRGSEFFQQTGISHNGASNDDIHLEKHDFVQGEGVAAEAKTGGAAFERRRPYAAAGFRAVGFRNGR